MPTRTAWTGWVAASATVRDSFLRASDDVFALQGQLGRYSEDEILRPRHDVQNIVVEHSGSVHQHLQHRPNRWPRKSFNSRNFTLRDSDILHGASAHVGRRWTVLDF